MTSKDEEALPRAAIALRERAGLHALIADGRLPDTDDLLSGAPFFAGSLKKDVVVWCDSMLLSHELVVLQNSASGITGVPELRPLVQNLRDTGSTSAMRAVEAAFRQIGCDSDADRMLCYLACSDARDDARSRLIASSRRSHSINSDEWDRLFVTATVVGMAFGFNRDMSGYCERGLRIIDEDAEAMRLYDLARTEGEKAASALLSVVAAIADGELEQDLLEDRAEIRRLPSLVVVPALPTDGSGHRRDLQKAWKGIDGQPLPIVQRGDLAAHMRALTAMWPHAEELIEIVLSDLAARDEVRFKPTLIVGNPGSGKSSLARAICDQLGLPCELYSMAGIADGSMGGTSAQWSTARESVPLQLIKRSKTGSVAVVWDEVEKAGASKHNGNALDTLLPMLEVDQARRFRDLALEVECDLSMVSHFATANSIDGIPAPLRDRMRILVMPEPGWQHLGVLSKQIVDRVARERGVDPRWFAPLAEDEMDLVRSAWPGGSIRQLTRIVTTIIDGRDQLMGRC